MPKDVKECDLRHIEAQYRSFTNVILRPSIDEQSREATMCSWCIVQNLASNKKGICDWKASSRCSLMNVTFAFATSGSSSVAANCDLDAMSSVEIELPDVTPFLMQPAPLFCKTNAGGVNVNVDAVRVSSESENFANMYSRCCTRTCPHWRCLCGCTLSVLVRPALDGRVWG